MLWLVFSLLKGLLNSADKVEGVLREVVVFAVEDLLAAPEHVFNGDRLARDAQPAFSAMEWLGEEPVEPPGAENHLCGRFSVVQIETVQASGFVGMVQIPTVVAMEALPGALRDLLVGATKQVGLEKRGPGRYGIDRGVQALTSAHWVKVDHRIQIGKDFRFKADWWVA